LRLFIISIGASAELTVMVGKRVVGGVVQDQPYVHGEVCGSIDLFFFEIKGCVSLTIGAQPDDDPAALPLVAGVSLVSRSPALVEGSGTGRAIDGKLGDAHDTSAPAAPLITVPLDAIPVITFDAAPTVAPNAVMGANALGQTGVGANPWTRIGERWWRYEVLDVQLTGALIPATGGKTPSSWWTGRPPGQPVPTTALALLNWLPTPFSRAIPYGEELIRSVQDRWGTVCHEAAPPAALLWTFADSPWGPSVPGWLLEGIAWPDPPDTVRSAPAHGQLQVTEPWRIPQRADLDVLQGTEPARVVGDHVPCTKRGGVDTPTRSALSRMTTTLAKDLNTGPSAASSAFGDAAYREAVQAMEAGTPLGDLAAHHATTAWAPETTSAQCRGAILRSPVDDSREPAPDGSQVDREIVKKGWAEVGFTPDALRDAVRLTPSEPALELSVLLLVPSRALERGIVLRVEDPQGNIAVERPLTGADVVGTGNPLPAALTDPTGPWVDPVLRAARIVARLIADDKSYAVVWVPLRKLDAEIGSVVIGWRENAQGGKDLPPFYVVAMTALLGSEAWRESWDTTTIIEDRDALQSSLTQDPDDHALLSPGTTYTVAVTWRAASVKQDSQPVATTTPVWQPNKTQSYSFATEPASAAPTDLGPWILASSPGQGDIGVFCTEPVRIALAHQQVADLFGAYGKELRVVVRAASGKHPEPPGGGAPGAPWTLPIGPNEFVSTAKALGVKTPWREAVATMLERLDLPCIDSSGSSDHTVTITLPYTFEPLTDYLVDVHSVPIGAPPSATGLVHRIPFTTSRFESLEHFVSYVAPASVRARLVPNPAALSALPATPTGDQVDAAYQGAGLGVPTTPAFPAVEVLWTGAPVPQPVAIIVESSEPLWRSRVMPHQVSGPVDAADPLHHWWAGVADNWLALAPSTAPVAAGDLPRAVISRTIACPGRTRAVILLGAGARGTEARLDLVLAADDLAGQPERRSGHCRSASTHRTAGPSA
jgi:hypothetical protein